MTNFVEQLNIQQSKKAKEDEDDELCGAVEHTAEQESERRQR
jgi:hypothetical protein